MGRLSLSCVFSFGHKGQIIFYVLYAQLLEAFPVNDMGYLCWYLGCAFERDKVKGVVKRVPYICFLRQLLFHLRSLTNGDRCSHRFVPGILFDQSGRSSFVIGRWKINLSGICVLGSVFFYMGKINQLC